MNPCTPQRVGTDQKIARIFPGSRREGSGGEQEKRPSLNRRLAGQTLAHGGQVQIRAFLLFIRWYSRAMLREAVTALLAALCDLFRSHSALLAENSLLRQQVILLHRAAPHPRLKARDRFTIGAITKLFPSLVAAVPIVRPDTVIRWHRSLWRLFWRRRSRRPVGRPPIDADTRALIRRMWTENPLWGEDVIAAELAKLGHHVSPATTRNSTCVAFINQIADYNAGARNVGEVCVINEVLGGRARRHLGVRPAPDAEDPALCPDVVLRRSRTQPRLGLADNSERWTVQGKWPRPLWVPGSRALAPGASSTPAGSPRGQRFFR